MALAQAYRAQAAIKSGASDSLPASLVGQLDLDFQHIQVVLAFQVDLDVLRADVDVFGNYRDQVALQRRQVVGLVALAARTFVRQDDLQPLFGDAGGLFLLAEQEGQK